MISAVNMLAICSVKRAVAESAPARAQLRPWDGIAASMGVLAREVAGMMSLRDLGSTFRPNLAATGITASGRGHS